MYKDYIAVVTARLDEKGSKGRTLLPINGTPLSECSIIHAKSVGLSVVVSTDVPHFKKIAKKHNCELFTPIKGCSLRQQLDQVIKIHPNKNLILLNGLYPFRVDGIIETCIETHKLNPNSVVKTQYGGVLTNCISVYPSNKNTSKVVGVEQPLLSSLCVSSDMKYIDACRIGLSMIGAPIVRPEQLKEVLIALKKHGFGEHNYMVVRGGCVVDQDKPTMYVNHCLGYEGGRVDAVMLVANKSMKDEPPNWEMGECIRKCKLAIIRDHNYVDSLLDRYPELESKCIILKTPNNFKYVGITTGAITNYILNELGGVTKFGASNPIERVSKLPFKHFHYKGGSFDVSIMS